MRLLGGVAVLVLAGCAGGFEIDRPEVTYRALVDTDWSPEQAEEILEGLDFWRGEVGDWVSIEATVAPCDETVRDCIAAVSSDSLLLRECAESNAAELEEAGEQAGAALRVVGVTTAEVMALDVEADSIGDLFRHEWGHRLGLGHGGGGVMNIRVGSREITQGVLADLASRGLR